MGWVRTCGRLGEAVVRKTLLLLMRVGERMGEVMGMGEIMGDSGGRPAERLVGSGEDGAATLLPVARAVAASTDCT